MCVFCVLLIAVRCVSCVFCVMFLLALFWFDCASCVFLWFFSPRIVVGACSRCLWLWVLVCNCVGFYRLIFHCSPLPSILVLLLALLFVLLLSYVKRVICGFVCALAGCVSYWAPLFAFGVRM